MPQINSIVSEFHPISMLKVVLVEPLMKIDYTALLIDVEILSIDTIAVFLAFAAIPKINRNSAMLGVVQ
jgi:hypothetical protein